MDKKDKYERPEAYPKPTETDTQLKNQDEYTERQSSRKSDDIPVSGGTQQGDEQNRGTEGPSTQGI